MRSPTSVTFRILGTLVLLSLLALPVVAGLRPDPDPVVADTCWTFRGEVLKGVYVPPESWHLAGVQMQLIGSNNPYPGGPGTTLDTDTTLANGSYALTTCQDQQGVWEFYHVKLILPSGCTPFGVVTRDGEAKKTLTLIEYTWPLAGKSLTEDIFALDCPLQTTATPTPTATTSPQCWRLQGKVFDADYPGETQPLQGIELRLVGCNNPYPAPGTPLGTATTNTSGWYGLEACDASGIYDFYRIHLQVPAGWEAVNATSVDGDVKANKQVIEFVWPLSTKDLTGNKFWIRPLQKPTLTPTVTDQPRPTLTPTDQLDPTRTPTDRPSPTPTPTDQPAPTPTPTVGPAEPCENILPHGSFESGILPPWHTLGSAQVSSQYGHDGTKSVLLTDQNNSDGELVADIALPPTAASLTLRYWWLAVSQDPDPHDDFLNVLIEWPEGSDHLGHHEHWENPGYWNLVEVDLMPYAGQHVTLIFHGHNGPSFPSVWFVDHVEIEFCPGGGGGFRLFLPLVLKAIV